MVSRGSGSCVPSALAGVGVATAGLLSVLARACCQAEASCCWLAMVCVVATGRRFVCPEPARILFLAVYGEFGAKGGLTVSRKRTTSEAAGSHVLLGLHRRCIEKVVQAMQRASAGGDVPGKKAQKQKLETHQHVSAAARHHML